MTPIEDLNARFTYASDGDQHGDRPAWFVLTDDGPVKGDCEDYALTLAWLECGRSWPRFLWSLLRGRWQIWSGTAGDTRHAVLRDGRTGEWADNIWREWMRDLGAGYAITERRSAFMICRKLIRSWWARR